MQDILQIPSDSLGIKLRQIVGVTGEGPKLYVVNLTQVYTEYVDTIESKINVMYKQGNTYTFKFLIEQLIILLTKDKYKHDVDNTVRTGYPDDTAMIDALGEYIVNNNIPITKNDSDVGYVLHRYIEPGSMDSLMIHALKTLMSHGIQWDDANLVNAEYGYYLPLEWRELTTDIVNYRNRDVTEYRKEFKYDKDISICIGGFKRNVVEQINNTDYESYLNINNESMTNNIGESYV